MPKANAGMGPMSLVKWTLIGLLVLPAAELFRLRAAFARDGIRALHLETPGMATMLGGILLIFPGFITDLLGAALLLPPVRRWAAAKFPTFARSSRRTPRDDGVIELEPGEWHQIPDRGRRRRHKSKRSA